MISTSFNHIVMDPLKFQRTHSRYGRSVCYSEWSLLPFHSTRWVQVTIYKVIVPVCVCQPRLYQNAFPLIWQTSSSSPESTSRFCLIWYIDIGFTRMDSASNLKTWKRISIQIAQCAVLIFERSFQPSFSSYVSYLNKSELIVVLQTFTTSPWNVHVTLWGELAVSYRWSGWVWEITGWSWRLQEN